MNIVQISIGFILFGVAVFSVVSYNLLVSSRIRRQLHTQSNYLMAIEKANKPIENECVKCGHEISLKENFCWYCGDVNPKRKTCKKCGTLTYVDARYCPHCRYRLWMKGATVENKPLYVTGQLYGTSQAKLAAAILSDVTDTTNVFEVATIPLSAVSGEEHAHDEAKSHTKDKASNDSKRNEQTA